MNPWDNTPIISNIDKALDKTKGQLFFEKGSAYLGRLMCDVRFEWSEERDTAAISVKTLFWNPRFFSWLSETQRVTVLAHELLHNGLLHTVRLGNRCPDHWNIAADHVINLWLQEHKFDMSGFPYFMDPKYIGWTTEQIYDEIHTDNGGGGTKPSNMPGDGLGGDIVASDDKGDIERAVSSASAAVSAAHFAREPGTVPGEVPRVIEKFLYPKLPWNRLLADFFNELVDEEFSYARPRRRYDDPYLPGRTGRNGLSHLVYGIDISGSTFSEPKIIERFFSEVKHIHEDLRPERITIVTFDTKVCDVFELERDDAFAKFDIKGGGGTDLVDLFAYGQKHEATAMVVFTDLYVDIPQNPGFPIIWVCFANDEAEVPYGRLIKFSETAPVSI